MIVYEDFDDSAMIPMSEHRRLVSEAVAAERDRCLAVCSLIYEYGGTPSLDEWPRMREAIESGIEPGDNYS